MWKSVIASLVWRSINAEIQIEQCQSMKRR
jgi:hypothetical protein